MAYYYVDTGGTATGDGGRYASKQTGSFASLGASGVYATLAAAMGATTTPTSGDFICVSDTHAQTLSADLTVTGPQSGDVLTVISVDDANVDTYSAASAAQIDGGTSWDLYTSGRWVFYGMYIKVVTHQHTGNNLCHQSRFIECTLERTTGYNPLLAAGAVYDEGAVEAIDCTLIGVSTTKGFDAAIGGAIFVKNCTISGLGTQPITGGFVNGGGRMVIEGCSVSSSYTHFLGPAGGDSANDDSMDVLWLNCYWQPSTGFALEEFSRYEHRLRVIGTGTTAAAEYQYFERVYGGDIEEDTAFYRTGSTAFPSGQKISLKIATTSSVSRSMPMRFIYPTKFCAFDTDTTDTVSIYILSASALTDADIWAEISYPDGTNIYQRNLVRTSVGPLAAGTALATNTEAWNGYTSQNRYQIDLDTSGDVGADCVPTIRVYVGKPSATFYMCPTVVVS